MQLLNSFLVFVFLCFCSLSPAQSSLTPSINDGYSPQEEEAYDKEWTIYSDSENKLFYIDFETLTFNIEDIVVKNESEEVIFKDRVLDLPVNTIYELDFSKYKSGTYFIELSSFIEITRKSISLD